MIWYDMIWYDDDDDDDDDDDVMMMMIQIKWMMLVLNCTDISQH